MSISSHHPLYADFLKDWDKLADAYRGERVVKEAGQKYLPPTAGQLIDGMGANEDGYKNYQAYKTRARFPGFLAQAVEALLGIMHHKPANIELPSQMESLLESATVKGESLENLLRRINESQLVDGRVGLLADVPDGAPAGVLPYIATYCAKDIINWDDGARNELVRQTLNLVVLNETEPVRGKDFEWENEEKYRVLVYGEVDPNEPESAGLEYRMGVYTEEDGGTYTEDLMITPSIAGKSPDQIPFVFINSKDIVPDPDSPPLLGLAELAFAVYRSEADYRQSLFMQGQDTLVIIGGMGEEEIRAGAGATITVTQGGDAKYIGVESAGLEEQRMAIENDRKEAADIGGKLLDTSGRDAESGDALRIRVSARTASLNQIALAGASGLETILKMMARWIGAPEDQVVVTPNLDFADDEVDGRTLVDIMAAKMTGLKLSDESIHEYMQEKGLTKNSFEEEQQQLDKEDPLDGGDGTGAGGDPDADSLDDGE